MEKRLKIFTDELISRYPVLEVCLDDIIGAYEVMEERHTGMTGSF